MKKPRMSDAMFGILTRLPDTFQEAATPSGLLPEGVEEPKYILRGNKVECPRCGQRFSRRGMYSDHFVRRHM